MEIIVDTASPAANSYQTVEEASRYVTGRDGFDAETWTALSDDEKGMRLVFGAALIDSLHFRGMKATKNQALAFPRLLPGDPLYLEDKNGVGMPFQDWDDLQEYAALRDVPPPVIPDEVKFAQSETTYQVVHTHMMNLEPMDSGEEAITSLGIDVIRLSFGKASSSALSIFSKTNISAITPVSLYLRKYLTEFRGALL